MQSRQINTIVRQSCVVSLVFVAVGTSFAQSFGAATWSQPPIKPEPLGLLYSPDGLRLYNSGLNVTARNPTDGSVFCSIAQSPGADPTSMYSWLFISADGQRIACKYQDYGFIDVFHQNTATSYELMRSLTIPGPSSFREAVFLPGNKLLAQNNGYVSNVETGEQVLRLYSSPSVASTPTGKYYAVSTNASDLLICKIADNSIYKRITMPGGMHASSIKFSNNGKVIVVAGDYGSILVRVSDSKIWQLDVASKAFELAAVSPDGYYFALSTESGFFAVYSTTDGLRKYIGQVSDYDLSLTRLYAITFSAVDDSLALYQSNPSASEGCISIINPLTGILKSKYSSHKVGMGISQVIPSPNGTIYSAGLDGTVRGWSATTGAQIIQPNRSSSGEVHALTTSPDGNYYATGSIDGAIRIMKTSDDSVYKIYRWHQGSVEALAFSPNSKYLVSGGMDGRIGVWDLTTGAFVKKLPAQGNGIFSVAYSANGQVAVGTWSKVKIIDVATATVVKTLTGFTAWVYTVVFSPDGTKLAAGGWDCSVRLYDVTSNYAVLLNSLVHFDSVLTISFRPDSKTFVAASYDGSMTLWSATSKSLLASYWEPNLQPIDCASFSLDGQSITYGSDQGGIYNVSVGP